MPENMISIRCWHIHIIHSGRLLHFQNCVYGFEARVGIWNGNFILQNKTFPIFITKSSNTIYPKICIFSFRVLKAVKHRHIGILYRSAHENLLNWFTSRLLYFMVDRALGCYCCCSSRQALAIFLHTHGLNYLKITFLSPSTHKFISLLTMLPCFISALLIQHSYTHTYMNWIQMEPTPVLLRWKLLLEDKKKLWVKEDEKIIAERAVNHASKCQRLTTERPSTHFTAKGN